MVLPAADAGTDVEFVVERKARWVPKARIVGNVEPLFEEGLVLGAAEVGDDPLPLGVFLNPGFGVVGVEEDGASYVDLLARVDAD